MKELLLAAVVLACPLTMVLMMRRGSHGGEHDRGRIPWRGIGKGG